MMKSHQIAYDEWMVSHPNPVGEYEKYPEYLKTTVCPGCLTSSNEYGFGVDEYKYFTRNVRKHEQIKEFFDKTIEERFNVLADEFSRLEKASAILDKQNNRPRNTRCRATFEKIWSQREQYGVPFFTLMLEEPRDYVTTLVCFALDRYSQMVRIAYNYDVEPESWDYKTLKDAIVEQFSGEALDMKSPEPRFYFIGSNYLHCTQILDEMTHTIHDGNDEVHEEDLKQFWKEAYTFMKLSFNNDDLSAIPHEVKDGAMNFLLAKLHLKFDAGDEALKCLRYAKNYADNRLKSISSSSQQQFVNDVDEYYKKYIEAHEEEGEEGEEEKSE